MKNEPAETQTSIIQYDTTKISSELDQVLTKYSPEQVKPLNLTKQYEEKKKDFVGERIRFADLRSGLFGELLPYTLEKQALEKALEETRKDGDEAPFWGYSDSVKRKVEEILFEWRNFDKKEQLVQTALQKIKNQPLCQQLYNE